MQDLDQAEETKSAFSLPTCDYCGANISSHQAIQPGHCGREPCFLAHITRGEQAQENQRSKDYAERQVSAKLGAASELAQAAEYLNCDEKELKLAVVPYQGAPIEPISPEYRAALQEHLETIVAAAFESGSISTETVEVSNNSSEEPSIVAAACGTCQGFCCTRGGGDNFAFLTVKSILEFLSNNHEMSIESVVSHYLDALPDASVRGGCAFQSDQGCTLARNSRASLCNSFYCHDLYALHDLSGGRSDVKLAIVGIVEDVPYKVSAFSAKSGSKTIVRP